MLVVVIPLPLLLTCKSLAILLCGILWLQLTLGSRQQGLTTTPEETLSWARSNTLSRSITPVQKGSILGYPRFSALGE